MDWSKHKFFVGLRDEDDGSIDLMAWMMNRFYYQRRSTVTDNAAATHAVVAADSAVAADSGDCGQPRVCKSVPSVVSFSILSDTNQFERAAAMRRSRHKFYWQLVAIEQQSNDNGF